MTGNKRLIPRRDPPLADTLRLMMPAAHTTLLLQAALLQGDAVATAWSQWRQTVPDPKGYLASDRVGIKRHLPLLYRNLVSCGVDLGRDLEPYFRAARAREELRSARYRRFLGEAIGALRQAGIDYVVGKGVTVGETVHTDPVVRHTHDIDLLVGSADMTSAADALRRAGFLPSTNTGPRGGKRFDHESGLPVELHDRMYQSPFYDGELSGPFGRARRGEVVGVPALLLGDADLLVHAPVHASVVPQRRGLSWIVDVISLLRRRDSEGAQIDWTAVIQIARNANAALPLYAAYQYLAKTFNASIPAQVIDELNRLATKSGPLHHLAAVDGLRSDPHVRLKSIADASGWRSRAAMARAMLLPPLAYLKLRHPDRRNLLLPALYIARPIRFLARQTRRIHFRLRQRFLNPSPAVSALLQSDSSPGADRTLT